MCEVTSQWIADRIREAGCYRRRHVRKAGERSRRSDVLTVQHGNSDDPLGSIGGDGGRSSGDAASLHVRGDLPLPLVPAVLEPDLHLRLGQVQRGGQPGSLRAAQVALEVKGGLQLEHLTPAEHSARLLLSHHFHIT